ncbi:MAG: ATP-binding cassette domain-containing protein [Patescibacteria group bacterium]|nr:ATP-binding cassette domain-containing protein [Patescibacteria group bacterium]MCL5224315.1 ATP-binding cassette domain-containing protein [Patescibacteria group bacterium]
MSDNIIEVRDLVKDFDGFRAVNDVSFTVPARRIFSFLGPNGAGKTTSIKILTTMLHPTSGVVRVNGFDPVTQQNEVRHSFGIVFQDPSLDDELTAYENMEFHGVLYGMDKATRRARIKELLDFMELWDRKDNLVKEFSGGMKRRLEIARGLLHHPKILFMDEPTLGLDPQTRNHIWGYIRNLNKTEGITVFFTTHYIEEAEHVSDTVAIMDHGRIITHGSPDELKRQTGASSLEEAFLKLTGSAIREEEASSTDRARQRYHRMHH